MPDDQASWESSAEGESPIWALASCGGDVRPEWMVLGKRHSDRARQFKPFAALRGYDEMVASVIESAMSAEDDMEGAAPDVP